MVEMQKVSFKRHKSGLPWQLSGKDSTCQHRRYGFLPWSGKIPEATEQLSLCTAIEPVCSRTQELQALKPYSPRSRTTDAPQREA